MGICHICFNLVSLHNYESFFVQEKRNFNYNPHRLRPMSSQTHTSIILCLLKSKVEGHLESRRSVHMLGVWVASSWHFHLLFHHLFNIRRLESGNLGRIFPWGFNFRVYFGIFSVHWHGANQSANSRLRKQPGSLLNMNPNWRHFGWD